MIFFCFFSFHHPPSLNCPHFILVLDRNRQQMSSRRCYFLEGLITGRFYGFWVHAVLPYRLCESRYCSLEIYSNYCQNVFSKYRRCCIEKLRIKLFVQWSTKRYLLFLLSGSYSPCRIFSASVAHIHLTPSSPSFIPVFPEIPAESVNPRGCFSVSR